MTVPLPPLQGAGPSDGPGRAAVWRRIVDSLRDPIESGAWPPGAKLPIELELAAHFRVNRHTVRRALSELARDGLVATTQGRGTFITAGSKALYIVCHDGPLANANWRNIESLTSLLVAHRVNQAGRRLGDLLGVEPTDDIHEVELILGSKGIPLALASVRLAVAAFPGFDDAVRKCDSIEATLGTYGVDSLAVRKTRVSGRLAEDRESALLKARPPLPLCVIETVAEASKQATHGASETVGLVVQMALCSPRVDIDIAALSSVE